VGAVLAGAIAEPPVFTGGVAQVTVSVSAADVWGIIHQQMQIAKRR